MQRYMRADIRPSAQIELPDRSDIEPFAAAAAGK
jgi:hypothetical protein